MVAHAAPPGQEQGHKNAEDHEHRQEQSHGPGRKEDGQEGAYGYEQEQGHFHKPSHGIVNQNMMADEDSEEELIDDLLKDVWSVDDLWLMLNCLKACELSSIRMWRCCNYVW